MQLVNFWLLATAFLTAGYVSAIDADRAAVAAGVAMAGAATTLGFHLLERRTRYLTRLGEQALLSLQRQLAVASDTPELRILELANGPAAGRIGYGRIIRVMQFAVILGYLAAAGYAVSTR